jgi:hypothetical protein
MCVGSRMTGIFVSAAKAERVARWVGGCAHVAGDAPIHTMLATFFRASGSARSSRLKPPRIFAKQSQRRILVMFQHADMMPENKGLFLRNEANVGFLNDFNDGAESRCVLSAAMKAVLQTRSFEVLYNDGSPVSVQPTRSRRIFCKTKPMAESCDVSICRHDARK